MGFGGISIWQLLIILAIVLVLFGTKRLKNIGSDLGGAVKGFKKAVTDEEKKAEQQKLEQNEEKVIEGLVEKAVLRVFNRYYQADSLQSVVDAFAEGITAEASDLMPSASYTNLAARLEGLDQAARVVATDGRPEAMASAVEFVLEGLYVNRKIQKTKGTGRYSYGR